jgi:hypothetical protein
MGDTPAARRTMKKGISKSKAKGTEVPVALLNNLGLLELDEGRPEEGLRLFEEAQRQVCNLLNYEVINWWICNYVYMVCE